MFDLTIFLHPPIHNTHTYLHTFIIALFFTVLAPLCSILAYSAHSSHIKISTFQIIRFQTTLISCSVIMIAEITSILNKACKIFISNPIFPTLYILYNFILASYFHIYHITLYIQCSFKYDDLNGFEIISKFVDAFFHRIMYVCGRNIKLIF